MFECARRGWPPLDISYVFARLTKPRCGFLSFLWNSPTFVSIDWIPRKDRSVLVCWQICYLWNWHPTRVSSDLQSNLLMSKHILRLCKNKRRSLIFIIRLISFHCSKINKYSSTSPSSNCITDGFDWLIVSISMICLNLHYLTLTFHITTIAFSSNVSSSIDYENICWYPFLAR